MEDPRTGPAASGADDEQQSADTPDPQEPEKQQSPGKDDGGDLEPDSMYEG